MTTDHHHRRLRSSFEAAAAPSCSRFQNALTLALLPGFQPRTRPSCTTRISRIRSWLTSMSEQQKNAGTCANYRCSCLTILHGSQFVPDALPLLALILVHYDKFVFSSATIFGMLVTLHLSTPTPGTNLVSTKRHSTAYTDFSYLLLYLNMYTDQSYRE
jgi:hypothetical protein